MKRVPLARPLLSAAAAASLLVACGGGDSNGATGTLRLSLTDAPACGYDSVFVTVEKVRVHQSSTASDSDSGWSEVTLAVPQRVDLLELTNGALLPLGEKELPAGTYTQMRLVLGSTPPQGSPAGTLANSIKPTGGVETELTTPSGQQSGLKMNINIDVPAGKVADFAIDFDACKSFVKAGNSGKYLLKPVLAVIPILSTAGQRIVGFVDASLANTGTTVSAQVGGVPVRSTPPALDGRFTLYPVPAGNYDLVVTAGGRVNAVMTGVPVSGTETTVIGSNGVRINTPPSAVRYIASGTVKVGTSFDNTNGVVRALQAFTGGPTFEAASATANALGGGYSLPLPAGAPVKTTYAPNATAIAFTEVGTAGAYTLEGSAPTFVPKTIDITPLTADAPNRNFVFP